MSGLYAEKLPPNDHDAEEAVLGSLLIDAARMADVVGVLAPAAFYREANRFVYTAMLALYKRGEAIDQVTVLGELRRNLPPEDVNEAYLSHVVYAVPTPVHATHYARIVAECAVKRSLIEAAGEIASLGYDEKVDASRSVQDSLALLYRLHAPSRGGLRDIRDTLDDYLEETSGFEPPSAAEAPLPTGFPDIDAALGRLQRSDLIIVAARPSLGKSTLALNIGRNAAGLGLRVGVFSLEMSERQLAERLLSAEAEVDSHLLRLGLLSDVASQRVMHAVGALSDMPLMIDDTRQQTLLGIRSECERVRAVGKPLDMVIVDYLQLMSLDARRGNRVEEVGEMTRQLKLLAGELNVPVLVLSQLSRAIEQRPDHFPQLSDLRESGSIEQDADVVAFIHREDKYLTADQWAARHPQEEYPENLAQLIIAKNRHGPTQAVHLFCRLQFSRFETLARSELVANEPPAMEWMPYAET